MRSLIPPLAASFGRLAGNDDDGRLARAIFLPILRYAARQAAYEVAHDMARLAMSTLAVVLVTVGLGMALSVLYRAGCCAADLRDRR